MTEFLLVLNSGSSSVKFSAFQADDLGLLVRGQVEGIGTSPQLVLRAGSGELMEEQAPTGDEKFDHVLALDWIVKRLQDRLKSHRLVAVGHRVVHGGVKYATPIRIDSSVVDELEQLVPLHQPHHLAAIRAVFQRAPHLPQVACFDTAFHRTQPEVAQWFGLPRRYTDLGVRRYGFHGLSYEYVASVLPSLDAAAAAGRTIVAHLGNGASLCALRDGKSIATVLEMLMVWQLLQVRHLQNTPLILAGHFWDGLLEWVDDQMLRPDCPLVSPADLLIPQVLPDGPSIVQAIREHHAQWKQKQS